MKLIPTRVHGVLDYLTVGMLLSLPRLLGWSPRVTWLLSGSALFTLLYSLLTRYELGVARVLPMKGHLLLDALSGLLLSGSPTVLTDEAQAVKGALLGLGIFELTTTALSKSESGV